MVKISIYLIFSAILFVPNKSMKLSIRFENFDDECDVVEFYEAIDPDRGVKVLTSSGDLEEAELILVPAKLETGTYEIEISRKESNLYKLENSKYYIETRYCYEYATYDDAILKVESIYGYTKGTIYFK